MGNGEEFDGVILFNGQPMARVIQQGEIKKRLKDVETNQDQFVDADDVFNDLLEGE